MKTVNSKEAKELYEAILSLKDIDECRRFLRDLLTEPEIKEFSNRWQVVKMLDKKIPYEKITKKTGMSSTTIARIQKWLNGKIGGYRLMLDKMNKNKITNNKQKINNKVAHHTSLT